MLTHIKNYQITEELTSNGPMGVYKAEDELNGNTVVVKVLLPATIVEEHQKNSFLREISITASLRHKHIVKFLDSGFHNGLLFCVMEYCNGGNLYETIMKLHRPMEPVEAIPLIRQVLSGLDYAHNAVIASKTRPDGVCGIVHRDIKPENILINYNESGQFAAKIADFGLSKAFRIADQYGWTKTGDIGGSLAYVSKQQIINYKYVKPEVDVWSSAAVLFYLLTGFPPRGNSGNISFNDILSTPPVSIKTYREDLPEGLAKLIDSALDDSEFLHFKTAIDFRTELKKFI